MTEQPSSRTMKRLRKQGYKVESVEKWVASHNNKKVIDAAKDVDDICNNATRTALHIALGDLRRGGPGVRKDLFGFIDLIAVGNGKIIGIQATSTENISHRWNKILSPEHVENAIAWLSTFARLEIWGWKQYPNKIDRRSWRETIREVTLDDVVLPAKPF